MDGTHRESLRSGVGALHNKARSVLWGSPVLEGEGMKSLLGGGLCVRAATAVPFLASMLLFALAVEEEEK